MTAANQGGGPGGAPNRAETTGTPAVWAVIPARYGSSRFPGKPLAMIAGKPMIQHVVERASRAASISRVLVATDDRRIAEEVAGFGGNPVMTGRHKTGTDRIAEAVALEIENGHPAPEWVLNVQGDEPLIDPEDLERLIGGVTGRGDAVMGTLVYPLTGKEEFLDYNVVKAVLDRAGRALYFSRAGIPHDRESARSLSAPATLGWRHLGVYLYRTDFLHTFQALEPTQASEAEQLEQLRALEHGYPIHCIEAHSFSVGVDTPADLPKVEALLSN